MNLLRDKAVVAIDEGAGRGRRNRILEVVSHVLSEQKRNAIEMQAFVEDSALPLRDVIAEFPDLNDLVVAIASQQAARATEPLRSAMQSGAFDDVRSKLIEFGTGLRAAYSSVLIGFLRKAMAEGLRHEIRRRIYEEAEPPLPQHCATTSMRQLGRANSPSRTVLTLRKASWACCANRSTRNSLCTRKSSRSTGLPKKLLSRP